MNAVALAVLLFSFEPSTTPNVTHLCRSYERVMTLGEIDGSPTFVMSPFYQVGCEVFEDEVGMWARSTCGDLPFSLCGICVFAVDAEGVASDCGDVTGYDEDLP